MAEHIAAPIAREFSRGTLPHLVEVIAGRYDGAVFAWSEPDRAYYSPCLDLFLLPSAVRRDWGVRFRERAPISTPAARVVLRQGAFL